MITVAILTKNSEKTLEKTLSSLKNFQEILIIDTGSTDDTLKIARKFPVKIVERPLSAFGALRNEAAKLAKFDWILALDSDEVLSSSLAKEILGKKLDPKTVYELPFLNFYKNKLVKCCGWYPEAHIRLYHKKHTSFDEGHVHEGIETEDCDIVKLNAYVYHTPYASEHDFLRKMQLYTELFAEQNLGKKSTLRKALLHGLSAFFKSYLLKRGIFYGETGFRISLYNGLTAYYKYSKLKEKNASHSSLS